MKEKTGHSSHQRRQPSSAVQSTLTTLKQQDSRTVETFHTTCKTVEITDHLLRKAGKYFAEKGLFSPYSLIEKSLSGDGLAEMAKESGLRKAEMEAIIQKMKELADPVALERLKTHIATPKGKGQIDWTDKNQVDFYGHLGIHPPKALDRAAFQKTAFSDRIYHLISRGPKKAVDLRPFLGDARNQGGRGTCAVFGATANAEAFECFRDHRNGPIDLAEQFVWWYRGGGQRYSAGGYDCGTALDDIREMGICEEYNLPYNPNQSNNNHTQVPISEKAMDRAQFYRIGKPVGLPWGDIDAVKRVLESGRCVNYGSNLDGWNTGSGEISMPPDGTPLGGAHCTTIIGYIDKDGLPENFEGGYFIIRNSWGGAGNPFHVMGPDYGGHLLMPYGWYRRYAGWPVTTLDRNNPEQNTQWLVEYYDNRHLQGAPINSKNVSFNWLFIPMNVDIEFPQTVPDVNFNWNFDSPVTFNFPLLGNTINALPTDNFSVRFSKLQRFREGWYRFRLRGDDGVRLYIDDRLVINAWVDQGSTSYEAEHYLTGGDHVIRIEYYEAGGSADIRFSMEPIQWHYELFRSLSPSGVPIAVFDDTLTHIEWRHQSPVGWKIGLPEGQFCLRGATRLYFKQGHYRFHASHSGSFKLYVDGVLRYNDATGATEASPSIAIAGGMHDIRFEFVNLAIVPAPGSNSYYKAFFKVGWSQETWQANFYKNTFAENFSLNSAVDVNYVFFRTSGLAGQSVFSHRYPKNSSNDLYLHFGNWDAFKTGIPNWPANFELRFFGVWINRKVFIPNSAVYNLELRCGEGFRLMIDGKEIAGNMVGIGDDPYNHDVYLEKGVHDISIEYNGTQWGGLLMFTCKPVQWSVQYFTNRELNGSASSNIQVNTIPEICSKALAITGVSSNFSARATRSIWLPLGRYQFQVTADDGVRLKINQHTIIDAWADQGATTYNGFYEHIGGYLTITLEYFQGYGDQTIDLKIIDQDFYGEYYANANLNNVPAGSTARRIAPVAYRYESDINFDFGAGSYLPRVGASNFSARWMGRVKLPVGRWEINALSDDGVRVYIDGRLLIDSWQDQGATEHKRMIDLTGRQHDVQVEYYQKTGKGVCRVKYLRVI